MSKTPNFDLKIAAILAETKPGERVCALTGEKWMMTDEEIGWYKKFNVPPSKQSPLTRMRLITCMWPSGQWWWCKHTETGAPIVTGIHPASGVKVLSDKEWFTKEFQSVMREYDPLASFIEQLYALRSQVPTPASKSYEEPVNSISIASWGDQDSYFVSGCRSKNSFYSFGSFDIESSSEVGMGQSVTNSFQVVHSERIHNCRYVRESRDCLNSYFLFDCRNCEFCFGATNKRNQKYLFFNEQLSAEEYGRRIKEINLGRRSVVQKYQERFDGLIGQAIWPENFNENAERCIGEYLTNCLDSKYVYYGSGGAQRNYWCLFAIGRSEGNAFTGDPVNASNNYGSSASGCHGCLFSSWISRCQSCEFCIDCYDCEFCFGCVGLRHKKFCILNKQYDEASYWQQVDEIKSTMLERGEYGEVLPAKFSPCYFPESGGAKLYLADDEFGRQAGGHMFDPESEGAIGQELMLAKEVKNASDLPDSAEDLDGWAGVPLYDPVLKRRFALLSPEVDFYKEHNIAPPNEHSVTRIRRLFNWVNSGVFVPDKCAKCSHDLIVAKNAAFPVRTIYCRQCYLRYLEER